jgi:copper chaperone CopZ
MVLELFQTISVEGMTCPHCEANVTRNLTKLDGIDEVVADRNTAQVKITGTTINLAEIEQVITGLGYQFKGSIE